MLGFKEWQRLAKVPTFGQLLMSAPLETGDLPRRNRSRVRRTKTTLNIDDTIMEKLKREAARQGRTMSELVESALRLLLRSHRKREKLVALPTFHSGGTLVDIADRNALYQAVEGR